MSADLLYLVTIQTKRQNASMPFIPRRTHLSAVPGIFKATLWTGAVFAALSAANAANAQEFECSVPGDKRFIRLELPGQEHLCEVSVTYQDQTRRVMWYANNETMFCSAKIYELRGKYEEEWGFGCTQWLDTDGIDKLSERHRAILDQELKILINAGLSAEPPYRVSGVKAVASNPLNLAEGTLALQYFIVDQGENQPRDITHVLYDDGTEWESVAQLDSLSNYIDSATDDEAVTSALVSEITDAGVLSVNTTVNDPQTEDAAAFCQGRQTLLVQDGAAAPSSPHQVLCSN